MEWSATCRQDILNGIEIKEAGQGPVLILLHGLQSTADVWAPIVSRLTGYRIVLINMPGRGKSNSWNPSSGSIENYYNIDYYTDILSAVIKEINEPVRLAGWSMGAMLALRYIERHGADHIRGLFLLSGVLNVNKHCTTFVSKTINEIEAESEKRRENNKIKDCASASSVAHTWCSLQGLDFACVARSLSVPAWVIHGESDSECSIEGAKLLSESIPGSIFHVIPESGHMLLSERPETIAEIFMIND